MKRETLERAVTALGFRMRELEDAIERGFQSVSAMRETIEADRLARAELQEEMRRMSVSV